jgi:putative ABC transport system permease protein
MAVAALTLAISSTTATFSVFSALLLRPLPYPEPDRLVAIWNRFGDTNRDVWLAPPELDDLAREARSFDRVGGLMDVTFTLTGSGETERLTGLAVTPTVLELLGGRAVLGRSLTAGDDEPTGRMVAVISHDLWTRRFGQRAAAVGRSLQLDGRSYEVVGVLPAAFELAPLSSVMPARVDLWTPLQPALGPDARQNRTLNMIHGLGRLAPGTSLAAARAEADALVMRATTAHPAAYGAARRRTHLVGLHAQLTDAVRAVLWLVMAAVALVMAVAIANASSLLVGMAVARRSEVAVRVALGASRADVVRQFVVESLVIGAIAGVAGVVLAHWLLPVLVRWAEPALPASFHVTIDRRVWLFAIAATLVAAVLAGTAPAWRASRDAAAAGLRRARATGSRHLRSSRRLLVAGQAALATLLLLVTGSVLSRLADVLAAPAGFEPGAALTFRLSPPPGDRTPDRLADLFDRTLIRLGALPGVMQAGAISHLPMSGAFLGSTFRADPGMHARSEDAFGADHRAATPGYLGAAGLRLVRGRWFDANDRRNSLAVAVIDETLANRLWPGRDPLGRQLRWMRADRALTIVGVVGAVRHYGLATAPRDTVYRPYTQFTPPALSVVLRARGDLSVLEAAIAPAVREVDAALAVSERAPFEWLVARSAAQPVLQARLVSVFGGVALTLAALGLYGLLTYIVSERVREIAVRVALGATRRRILGGMLGETMQLWGLGCGLGLLMLAVGAGPWLRSLQLDTWPDTSIALGALLTLLVAAGAATIAPALRAMRIDPAIALRRDG